MIGVMKGIFYKTVGSGLLTWEELSEILLDIEIAMNNRPLNYMEEDVELPTLTPNSMLFTSPTYLPELKAHHEEHIDLRKRAKFLRNTKDQMWRRWTNEYMRALREHHRLKHQAKDNKIAVGDVVIIKSDDRNRNHWPLGIVERLIKGKDGVVRAVRLRSGRDRLERAIQHLYPLELSCDTTQDEDGEQMNQTQLDPKARVFVPKRKAAVDATERIRQTLAEQELNNDFVET